MTKTTRQFITLIFFGIIGATLIVTEAHRHAIALVWPTITAVFG